MNTVLHLDDSLLFNEGATRKCYLHPSDQGKCLKIEKKADGTNRRDLESYHAVRAMLHRHIAAYDDELAETNMGKALVCELIIDSDGQPAQSFAEYRQTQDPPQQLMDQFLRFFELLQKNDLFFYDFNPKNFMIQRTPDGICLKYTDLKSLGKTRTMIAVEKIPYFARRKLKRRVNRFIKRYLMQSAVKTSSP